MNVTHNPLRLFTIAVDLLIPIFEEYGRKYNCGRSLNASYFETFGSYLVEEFLFRAVRKANESHVTWKNEWKIFFTSKIKSAAILWDEEVLNSLRELCKCLSVVEVLPLEEFQSELIKKLPLTVIYLRFLDETSMAEGPERKSWLPEAEEILKSMFREKKKIKEIDLSTDVSNLTEVDLGSVTATSSDIQVILKTAPRLKILRHYQMVKALFDLHAEDWKKGLPTPTYALKNLDVDFSHIIRCRMSPEWVLAPNALHLATILCPQARSIHLRFDCSTPNDVLTPLLNLKTISEFSAVCVSSGERTLLDFSDITPILELFGPITLTVLELKVIEEVEMHVVIENCKKLETLILSGCGYMTPPTCPSYDCASYKPGTFKHLRHLFFADGDDFSWDHGAPECFWRAALLPPGRQETLPLQALLLEYPRIPDPLTAQIFKRVPCSSESQLPFPNIKVASLCRYNELTLQDIVALCGLENTKSPPVYFLRISDCDLWEPTQEKQLQNWFKQKGIDCQVQVTTNSDDKEVRKPYSFKIFRPR